MKFAETSDGSEASRATPKGGIPIKERFYLGGQAKAGISGCGTPVRKGRLAGQVDLEILGADVVSPAGPGGPGIGLAIVAAGARRFRWRTTIHFRAIITNISVITEEIGAAI